MPELPKPKDSIFSVASIKLKTTKYTRRRRVNTILYRNRNFNPQSHPSRRLRIQSPVCHYMDENNQRKKLVIQDVPERQLSPDDAADEVNEYYTEGVTDVDNYIDSAYRSTRKNEAYIFIREENVVMNYGPATRDDKIISGLRYIGNTLQSLVGTAFAEHGIDAAFACHDNHGFLCARSEAMIFSANLCARINFAPRTTRDRIIQGPKTISQMFPFFKGTSFEKGIDAAFESTVTGEDTTHCGCVQVLPRLLLVCNRYWSCPCLACVERRLPFQGKRLSFVSLDPWGNQPLYHWRT
uniref:Uncharacterized protein n=1 Tax=Oryza meridionalis TaxID=40149 RepID=A0A0E0DBG4_9ORYZ